MAFEVRERQVYTREDGAHVRVDRVANGQVHLVSWRPSHEEGVPIRMTVAQFEQAIAKEGMKLSKGREA